MANDKSDLLTEVAAYYSSRFAEHGVTPQGVDWNGEKGQVLRFEQLCRIINSDDHFSVNDLGCGYGALYEFLAYKFKKFKYSGLDISEDMIQSAKARFKNKKNAKFVLSSEPDQIADYGIASGIFNVRQDRSDDEWSSYIEQTLDILDRTSLRGFAFNCLTSYSDVDKMRQYLFYADPCDLFDRCKRIYSRHVALLHDYGLYEFTILVRKQL